MPPTFYVYILASPARRLYVGVTSDLVRRLAEHRARSQGYTARYGISRLVHVETSRYVLNALRREKEIKGWRRAKKVALIETSNPGWEDLTQRAVLDRLLR